MKKTLFNEHKKIQGFCDAPLAETSIHQAKTDGNFFKNHDITFDQAYSSKFEWACDTLELVTAMNYTRIKA